MHLGASNDKAPTGLQVVDGVLIQVPCWHDSPDHLLLQGSAHVLQRYVFVVLHGDDDGISKLAPHLSAGTRGDHRASRFCQK